LMTTVPRVFVRLHSDWTLESSCWFPVTLPVLRRTVHCTLLVLNHLSLTSVGSLVRVRKPRHQQCRTLIGSNTVTSHATAWLVMHVLC